MISIRIAAGAALLGGMLASGALFADPPAGPGFNELGHEFPGFDYPYRYGFAVADFDGDGKDDFAFAGITGIYSATSIQVVGEDRTGAIRIKQSEAVPFDDEHQLRHVLALADPARGPSLLLVDTNGTITQWSGWPLHEVRSFPALPQATGAAVGDIDADGTPDLVLRNPTTLAAYSTVDGAQKWSIASGGDGSLLLAELDADPALEIVLGDTTPGTIVDGATQMVDWTYPDSFGHVLASGRLADPAGHSFVGNGNGPITVYSGQPYSPIWDYQDELYFFAPSIAVTDVDGDGIDEIVFDQDPGYGLSVLDSATHQVRESYSYGYDEFDTLAPVNLDGSAVREIAAATSIAVTLFDPLAEGAVWSATSRNVNLSVAALGDIDRDGRTDFVTSGGFMPWDRPAGLEIRDMDSGASRWQSDPVEDADVYSTAPNRILITTPSNPSDEPRILTAGSAWYDGRAVLVGGTTHTEYLRLGEYGGGPFLNRPIKDAAFVDMNGDGVDDILLATEPIFQAVTGAKLHAFTQSGALIWESVAMGSPSERMNRVLVLDAALGAGDAVVAVLPEGLRAYGRLTHTLLWTMDVVNDSAFVIEHGIDGPELGIESGSSIAFYDLASRAFLRSFPTMDPVEAAMPIEGQIDRLLVSSGGHLRLIDGRDGTELAATPFLGNHLAVRDQIAAERLSADVWRIGVGSDLGVFRYRLALVDRIFASGFGDDPGR